MINKRLTNLLIGALLAVPASHAITIDEAMSMLTQTLPSVDASSMTARAEVEKLRAEASLPGPELEFSYQWGMHDVGTKLNAGVSQSFDWPGVYASRHKAVKQAESSLSAVDQARRRLVATELRVMLVEFVSLRRQVSALCEIDTLLARMEEKMRRGYDGGEVTLLDINKLAIARANADQELFLARTKMDDLEGTISETSQTISHDILARLDDFLPAFSVPDEATYMAHAEQMDPEMLATLGEARSADISAEIERRSMLPGFSAGYLYSHEQGETFHGLSVGMTLPSRANARLAAAAKLESEAAKTSLEGARAAHKARYHTLVENVAALDGAIKRLGPVFEKHDNLRLLEKAFNSGQISVLDFLQELEYFSRARLDYLEDVGQYHVSLAKLNLY